MDWYFAAVRWLAVTDFGHLECRGGIAIWDFISVRELEDVDKFELIGKIRVVGGFMEV